MTCMFVFLTYYIKLDFMGFIDVDDSYMIVISLPHWWRDGVLKHTFHFRVGEATITLEDVQIIWALPIDGLPVTGLDIERSTEEWQIYCREYLGFSPDEEAFKGSPNLEEINTARNYSWGSAVLAFLYRELCHASLKGKAAIGGALQLLQIWAWSRIIPLSPGLGVERLYMDQVQVNIDRFLPAAPYGAIWNCRHNFTRTVRTTVRVIRDILDNMQEDQFIWQPYDMDSDRIMAYAADLPRIVEACGKRVPTWRWVHEDIVAEQIQALRLSNQPRPTDVEGLSRLLDRYDATLDNICQFVMHSNQNPTNENDPSTSHRQRRSNSRMSTTSAERDNIGVDIAGPSTAYTPQDYYVPQPSQQDDWFQSAPYMPSHAESYSAHVDLDLGLGVNQPYAPEYNVSPIPFPSFSAYRDQVESSSATTSSRLHINDDDDDNEQDEPTQNIVEEIRRPRRQRHRRNCGTGGHF
ncbi:UNVERIFIED_CONTAM: Serine/threonine-protein phosphatase 7 long form [Sesamum radiatum]|uniref:Serine/threonine-protein phosphatase 7 long form n=1 Tax=Sesamum radiatum TaxID=300843 RepID=A0AAW2W3J2_SESRA